MLRIGLVGYGTGGQHFHAPFIEAATGCVLAGVVARRAETVAKVQSDFPDLPIYASLTDMIAAGGIDAVTITTPPETRRELVLEAIAAGLHVVADKPFAPDYAGAMDLDRAAKQAGVVLGVYQNRRFDADLQTLKHVIDSGDLGDIWRIHSRMDQNSPQTVEAGPTGGLLRDLGSHVVDQMIYLLGPVKSVTCHMDHVDMPAGRTDVSFIIAMTHQNGSHSQVSASKLNHIDARELRVYGAKGSYVSMTSDIQAQDIFASKRPIHDLNTWGYEPRECWGTLYSDAGAQVVPSQQGRYHDYYAAFARSVETGAPPPVSAETGANTLRVLDAARESATLNKTIHLG